MTGELEGVGDLDQSGVRRVRLGDPHGPVGLEHAVALVAEHALEAESGKRLQHPGEVDGLLRRAHAGPVEPDVELDQHVDLAPRGAGRVRQLARVRAALDRDDHPPEPGDPCQLRGLDRSDHLVRDEHVRDPGIEHRAGLPDRRGRQADRARIELHPPERRALVDLRVRPQGGRQIGHATRHLGDVPLDRRQVEEERRSCGGVARMADHLPGVVQPAFVRHRRSFTPGALVGGRPRRRSRGARPRPGPPSSSSPLLRATGARRERRARAAARRPR